MKGGGRLEFDALLWVGFVAVPISGFQNISFSSKSSLNFDFTQILKIEHRKKQYSSFFLVQIYITNKRMKLFL